MIRGWFTVAYQPEKQPKWDEIRKALMDRENTKGQAEALEQLVLLSYTENIPPHLLMPVVQYTATTHDHRVIKLLLMFLENCDTRDAMGELRPEFILITDALRNFLLHPNEYVRGAVLRFLYKIDDRQILTELMEPILMNLKHREEYVRRHAAILVGRLARDLKGFDRDVGDAIIEAFSVEADQRTLTAMLYSAYAADAKGAANLTVNMNTFYSTDMKLALLRVTPKTYRQYPQFRVKLLEKVVDFCEDESISVRLQAAFVLRKLSNNQAAVRTTANAYCELLHTLTDENQKAFVVQELIEMIEEHRSVMASFALEMAQGISVSGQLRIRLLSELVGLVTEENAGALVALIAGKDKDGLEAMRTLLLRFPSVATVIVEQIGKFVVEGDRELAEIASVLVKDCGIAGARKEAFRVFSGAIDVSGQRQILARCIWGMSEFSDDVDLAASLLFGYTNPNDSVEVRNTCTVVSADGTYATKTVSVSNRNLRSFLAEGDSYLGLSIISALIRLKLRGASVENLQTTIDNILSFTGIEKNTRDICHLWLSAAESPSLHNVFARAAKESFESRRGVAKEQAEVDTDSKLISATDPLQFTVLLNTVDPVPVKVTPTTELPIVQLTGPSDPLYVEASCTLRKFDRVFHFSMYNRTNSTLTNVLFEFTPVGSVSILQRNDLLALAPNESLTFDLPVMISSGSCGTLFGAVSFDFAGAGGSDHQLLPLSPIEINPFYCFEPVSISQASFREKWEASMWERKLDIQTEERDLVRYLNDIASRTKCAIITPEQQIQVTSSSAKFIAVNLYTRSLFGEEVEINISAKLSSTEKITGFIRIRSQIEKLAYLFGTLAQ